MSATIDRFVLDVERSCPAKELDAKIKRSNDALVATMARKSDPWAKFRASLSIGRGNRNVGV